MAQAYADAGNGPTATGYQSFALQEPCVGTTGQCFVTATANQCGGTTFSGNERFGRVLASQFLPFDWPFDGDRVPRTFIGAGEVHIEGQRERLTLLPEQRQTSAALVFQPRELLRIATTGDVVPAFATEIQMPERVSFSAPDRTSSELVSANDPIEIIWTAEGSVGTVEAWWAGAFTPDAASYFDVVHCSSPLSVGHLTVVPTGSYQPSPMVTRALAIRVQNTKHLKIGSGDVQVAAASFDSGPVTLVYPLADAGTDSL